MAKEMMIIFVYDTQLVQTEEDDPADAVLYFHPSWVSVQQRTALCGQIIGTCHFLQTVFNCPRILSLQSGKFSIRKYGKYILAVGTDRNIADWVLEHRADTLTSLISFFHCDLQIMSELYENSHNLSAKLYHMFETYLKILMYGGHMFFNTPTIQLPKSASYVFLEAMQLLQWSQETNFVLGGTILYHNKVVATQLSSDLTKRLVLTDPYRIKSPAETVEVNYCLPLGVQLLKVYIGSEDYYDLSEDAEIRRTCFQFLGRKNTSKKPKSSTVREPGVSVMKRDQSLIFTTVPEEDVDHPSPVMLDNKIINAKSPDRPNFLNLKNKTSDFTKVETSKSIVNTPFHGPTSVCSTPMTDLNKVLHQTIVSICGQAEEVDCDTFGKSNNSNKSPASPQKAVQKSSLIHTSLHSNKEKNCDKSNVLPFLNISKNLHDAKKSNSMWEFREKLKTFNKRITMRNYGFGLPNLRDVEAIDEFSKAEERPCKTINDPMYPVFKSDGSVASNFLYTHCLDEHIQFLNTELYQNTDTARREEWKSIKDFDTLLKLSPKKDAKHRLNNTKTDNEQFDTKASDASSNPEKVSSPKFNRESRKSLTLPLKSLTSEQSDNIFSPANRGRNFGGVQLTPLMAKLSLLAMEDRSSGIGSTNTTPSEHKDCRFTPTEANYSFLNWSSKTNTLEECKRKIDEKDKDKLHKVVLFICGQQDMVMTLLMEDGAGKDEAIINTLWEKCTESLGKLEKQLRHCLEIYPGGGSSQSESGDPYSYLCMDPLWDTVQRGGPWSGAELGALTHLHRDFSNASNLTEIILRNDDSVIYGHHCGNTEVFYQQTASSNAGLPTPADLMGVVPLKARRRLERDHAIILL